MQFENNPSSIEIEVIFRKISGTDPPSVVIRYFFNGKFSKMGMFASDLKDVVLRLFVVGRGVRR